MNSLLAQPNTLPISLGWHCHVALFIQDLGDMERIRYERNLFDWMGIPMWAICELLDRSFAGLTDRLRIENRKRFSEKPDLILSHLDYDIRFLHEFKPGVITDDEWILFEQKYQRRIQRFQKTLEFSSAMQKKLLFFRVEYDNYKKIMYPEFVKEHDEKYYVERFADMMKERGVKFQIIFFTWSFPRGYDSSRNILYIQFKKAKPDVDIGANELMTIVQGNIEFIRSYLPRVS